MLVHKSDIIILRYTVVWKLKIIVFIPWSDSSSGSLVEKGTINNLSGALIKLTKIYLL